MNKKSKVKIGLLVSTLSSGGAERVVSRLTYILSEEFDVTVIVFEKTDNMYTIDVPLIDMDIKTSNSIIVKVVHLVKRAIRLSKIKRELELDVVISYLKGSNYVNILSKTAKCKVGISVRNYSLLEKYNSRLSQIQDLFSKLIYRKSDFIISVSDALSISLVKNYNLDENKVHRVYNPYDVNEIQQLGTEEIEPKYNDFFEGETLITVGRHEHQKGYWHLIKAFSIAKRKRPNLKLVMIGEGTATTKYIDLISKLGLVNDVLLIKRCSNPYKYIAKSNLYILTSIFEGFPNAMVEAMACGCPVVAADCKSGPREILYRTPNLEDVTEELEKADFGLLTLAHSDIENFSEEILEPSDFVLAKGIELLMSDKKLYANYSDSGRKRAFEFSYNVAKEKYKSIIESYVSS